MALRNFYHAVIPLRLRLMFRNARQAVRRAFRLEKAAVTSPEHSDVTVSFDPVSEIISLLLPIVQSRTAHAYDDLWQAHGFRLTLNFEAFDRASIPLPFDEGSEWQRVRDYPLEVPAVHRAAAGQAALLIQRLQAARSLDDHFDRFAAAGFHVTPLPLRSAPAGFLPNLFILGAAKCATTTLHAYLDRIDGVCMSHPKEPVFFESEFDLGLAYYQRRYFPHWRGEAIIGEARQRNLYLPFVPERIHQINPRARLIVMLRNPVDRTYAHWWHRYARGYEMLDFEAAIKADLERIAAGYRYETAHEQRVHQLTLDAVNTGIYRTYVDGSYYDDQIARYQSLFSPAQLLIVLSDDLRQRPFEVLREVEAFIGTDFFTEANFEILRENEAPAGAGGRVRPPIRPELRAWLADHFRPHIERTAALIGRDLSHWM